MWLCSLSFTSLDAGGDKLPNAFSHNLSSHLPDLPRKIPQMPFGEGYRHYRNTFRLWIGRSQGPLE